MMQGVRAAALAVGLMAAGCSVILNTAEPTQCSANVDCDANPSLRGRVCEEGFCVIPKLDTGPGDTPGGGPGCVDSTLCTQANSGKASHCAKAGGACTPWQTPQCDFISGKDAWKDRNALVIGAIMPFTVKQVTGKALPLSYGDRIRRAIQLGVDEVNAAEPGGIVLTTGPQRPIAVIHCDSGLDPVLAQSAFDHLTGVVRAEAIILGADEDLVAVTPRAQKLGTALVCSDCLGPLPPVPQAWRISPPLALQAPMAAWRVGVLETQRKAAPDPPAVLKVAVLTEPGRAQAAFVARFMEVVRFNGKSVADNGGAFTVVTTEDPLTQAVDHAAHAAAIRAFEPDVVVVAMGANFPTHYAGDIEAGWPAGKPKPSYVITGLNYDLDTFTSLLKPSAEDLRRRISGTRSAFEQHLQDNIDAFEQRYLPPNNYIPSSGNWSGYEAFYALLYAIVAGSAGGDLDGPHFSAGFARLRQGPDIDLGPADFGLGRSLLGQPNGTINVRGFWSELDWNLATHDLDGDASMFCFQRVGGALTIKRDAGPRFVASTGQVSNANAYACE